mmetsp:Transcript_103853/g.271170  ORF Transcript_103853/g.271170 Transcript_103853/m.271170 type:complete len:323 (+) Transcript_103853:529-1497(+)
MGLDTTSRRRESCWSPTNVFSFETRAFACSYPRRESSGSASFIFPASRRDSEHLLALCAWRTSSSRSRRPPGSPWGCRLTAPASAAWPASLGHNRARAADAQELGLGHGSGRPGPSRLGHVRVPRGVSPASSELERLPLLLDALDAPSLSLRSIHGRCVKVADMKGCLVGLLAGVFGDKKPVGVFSMAASPPLGLRCNGEAAVEPRESVLPRASGSSARSSGSGACGLSGGPDCSPPARPPLSTSSTCTWSWASSVSTNLSTCLRQALRVPQVYPQAHASMCRPSASPSKVLEFGRRARQGSHWNCCPALRRGRGRGLRRRP